MHVFRFEKYMGGFRVFGSLYMGDICPGAIFAFMFFFLVNVIRATRVNFRMVCNISRYVE